MYLVQNLYQIHQLKLTCFCLYFGTEGGSTWFDVLLTINIVNVFSFIFLGSCNTLDDVQIDCRR